MSRKNISLHEEIDRRAEQLILKRGFAGLSDLIAVLVREEWERRGLDASEMKDASPNANQSPKPEPKVLASYSRAQRAHAARHNGPSEASSKKAGVDAAKLARADEAIILAESAKVLAASVAATPGGAIPLPPGSKTPPRPPVPRRSSPPKPDSKHSST